MTPLEFIADVIGSLAWPVVLIVFLAFLRPHFSQILGLVRTVKFKEFEVSFGEAALDATSALEQFWMPDGQTPNALNEARLRSWLDENGLSDVSFTAFLNARPLEAARQRAKVELGLATGGDGGSGGSGG